MSTADTTFDAIVVGAGLGGLAAAWRLKRRGYDKLLVLEASARAGGCVQTIRHEGRLFETGPNSLRGHCPSISALVADVGLGGARIEASSDASERWLWLPGGRQRAPGGPGDLLKSNILSGRGRLRLLREPLQPPWRTPVEATTIAAFLRHRLGDEAFEKLGAPITTGIFAGEPEDVGVEAFLPLELAAAAGGLVRGMGRVRAVGGGSQLWTFRDGLQSLTDALAGDLDVRFQHAVVAVDRLGDAFSVQTSHGEALRAHRVVLATPAPVTARLVGAPFLGALKTASVATLGIAANIADFVAPPTGFGMLVSRLNPLSPVLGVVFASRIFADRALAGEIVMSVICGGTRHPEAVDLDNATLVERVVAALEKSFGFKGTPRAAICTRWPGAIPQIPPGHRLAVARLVAGLPQGMALAGNALGGVSLEQVATSGLAAADRVSAAPVS